MLQVWSVSEVTLSLRYTCISSLQTSRAESCTANPEFTPVTCFGVQNVLNAQSGVSVPGCVLFCDVDNIP